MAPKDELVVYANCCVKDMLGELLEEEDDVVRDVEFNDEDEDVPDIATSMSVSGLSEEPACDFEEVMSLMSDDDLEEEFYDKAATMFVQAALTEADLPEAVKATESVSEEFDIQADEQCVVDIEAHQLTEDFALDYISELIDAGIEGMEPPAQETLPAASVMQVSSRPKLTLRSMYHQVAVPPVPAETLPTDCLPTSLVQTAAPASSISLPLQADLTKRTVTRNRRRIIGGVVRDASATELCLSELHRSSSESSLVDESARSSSLVRQYDALGAKLYQMDQESCAGSRPSSRAGSPAWSLRHKASDPGSAMALDLGFAPSMPSKLAGIQHGHKSSGLVMQKSQQARPVKDLFTYSWKNHSLKGGLTRMDKSASLGSLTSGKAVVLPALSGTSRPSSPAGVSRGWSVAHSRLSATLGRNDSLRYAF